MHTLATSCQIDLTAAYRLRLMQRLPAKENIQRTVGEEILYMGSHCTDCADTCVHVADTGGPVIVQ